MEDEETELRNPFPSPPSHYTRYTTHNLNLLALYKERTENDPQGEARDQNEVLADQKEVPEWPLISLERPRVDWILEEGHYNVFGDTWFVKEKIPSLGELGGQQLYPEDPTVDRRPALLSILRSLLASYSHLLRALLSPPPSVLSTEPPEWRSHVEWINVMCQNIMSAANELRPVQARYNLEAMMTRQLELRREETAAVHRKCDELQHRLQEMKSAALLAAMQEGTSRAPLNSNLPGQTSSSLNKTANKNTDPMMSLNDSLRWAEEA